MVYNDATIAAYLTVTALLLPPFALFLYRTVKDYLQSLTSDGIMPEFLFLAVIFALYLVLNALYSAFWVSLRDEYHLASAYYIPYSLFLSLLLMFTLYSIFSLSVSKEKNRKHELELALMRQNYNHIDEKMQQQRRSLHDTRQLLRNLSTLAKEGSKEELLKYINDTMETTAVSEIQFCANPCINGLLQYYAQASETQGIAFFVQAACGSLPFTDTDLTILLGNVLSVYLGEEDTITIGISGGLYGLFAAYLVLLFKAGMLQDPSVMGSVLRTLVVNLAINFMPNVSRLGHAGGFIAGFAIAMIML
jgi:hypothetical protein